MDWQVLAGTEVNSEDIVGVSRNSEFSCM
jgi:hypothetical protein